MQFEDKVGLKRMESQQREIHGKPGLFSLDLLGQLVTAERNGALGPITELIGQHFEEEGEARLRELVALLEPIIIVVMGVIVALIVLSVMLPMFDLATFAQKSS